MADSQEIRDS
jgi:hypothetical protein